MKLRQARKIYDQWVKRDFFAGRWVKMPRFCCVRDSTRVRAFRRLLKNGEGPWV